MKMGNKLLIPYGLNSQDFLINASKARKEEIYRCPECKAILIFRKGDIRIPHFAHEANGECTYETIVHKIAKMLIAQVINEHLKTIALDYKCDRCKIKLRHILEPTYITEACLEKRIDKYICDVVALRNGESILAIEIEATHPMEEDKVNHLGLYWIELQAKDVLNNPYHWIPVRAKLKPVFCKRCKPYGKNLRQRQTVIECGVEISEVPNPKENPKLFNQFLNKFLGRY